MFLRRIFLKLSTKFKSKSIREIIFQCRDIFKGLYEQCFGVFPVAKKGRVKFINNFLLLNVLKC